MDGTGVVKARYFVVGDESMEYFVNETARTAAKPLGIIDFSDVLRVVSLPDSPQSFAVQAQYRTYHLTAENVSARQEWSAAIEKAVDDFQEFKELAAEADDHDAKHLVEQLEGSLGEAATADQSSLLAELRRSLAASAEKLMQTHQRAAIKAEEAEVFRDLQESANEKLAGVRKQEQTLALLRKKVEKLENNTTAIQLVLESADEHVRDVQMLLQLPSFDQRALEAKEKEFGELLGQITQIMADCELLAKRSFSDDQIKASNPSANPQLRQEIAEMQRGVAAARIQGAVRSRQSSRAAQAAAEREAAAEAARIAAEPPWQVVAKQRAVLAKIRVSTGEGLLGALSVMAGDGSVERKLSAEPEPEPEPEQEPRVESDGGAVKLSFGDGGSAAAAAPKSVLRECSWARGLVAPDSPIVEVEVAQKHKAAPPVLRGMMGMMGGGGDDDATKEEEPEPEMNPALMAMMGLGGGGRGDQDDKDLDDDDDDDDVSSSCHNLIVRDAASDRFRLLVVAGFR